MRLHQLLRSGQLLHSHISSSKQYSSFPFAANKLVRLAQNTRPLPCYFECRVDLVPGISYLSRSCWLAALCFFRKPITVNSTIHLSILQCHYRLHLYSSTNFKRPLKYSFALTLRILPVWYKTWIQHDIVIGAALIVLPICYLATAGLSENFQATYAKSMTFVFLTLLCGIPMVVEIIITLRIREQAANLSRNVSVW